jgi:plastocyanin
MGVRRRNAARAALAIGVFALVAVAAIATSRPAGAATATVSVGEGGNHFAPNSITVAVGDTVTWNWASGFHSVTEAGGSFDSGAHGSPGSPFSMTFNSAGEIYYYCSVHATAADANDAGIDAGKMVGEIVVQAQTGGTPTATASATATATQTATQAPTATPTASRTATPAATSSATPSAPKTGQAGLADADAGAATVAFWLGLAVVSVAGVRVLSQRPR